MTCKNCFQQLHTMKNGCPECGDVYKNHVYTDEMSEFTQDPLEKVVDIQKNKPHIVINTSDGDAHVYPVDLFKDIIRRHSKPDIIDDIVLRRIIEEWLYDYNGVDNE